MNLNEVHRSSLVAKSSSNIRTKKRMRVSVIKTPHSLDRIDMNKLFKQDIFECVIPIKGETDNYDVTISFGGVVDRVRKLIDTQLAHITRRGNYDPVASLTYNMWVRALKQSFDTEDVYVACTCLRGTTLIRTLGGILLTTEQLYERFCRGNNFYVYSYTDDKRFTPHKVEKIWITGQAKTFTKITLDNGHSFEVTGNHPILTVNGVYTAAEKLKVGDELVCFDLYRKHTRVEKIETITLPDYEYIYDIKVQGIPNFVLGSGVVAHNCPDFNYRFRVWATKNRYNSTYVELRPANITNPKDSLGSGCKHILNVLKNLSWVLRAASVIYNYVRVLQKQNPRLFDKVIRPVLFGEQDVQVSRQKYGAERITPPSQDVVGVEEPEEQEQPEGV